LKWLLLKDLIAGLMILFVEDAFLADGLVFAFGAYLLRVDEQSDILHHKLHGFGHRFAQRPG